MIKIRIIKYFIEWYKFESIFDTTRLKCIVKSFKYAVANTWCDFNNWLFDKGIRKTHRKDKFKF